MAIALEFETPGVRDIDRVRSQVWRYRFILVAWPAFLLLAPGLTAAIGAWSLIVTAPLGVFLFTWARSNGRGERACGVRPSKRA